MPSYTARWVSHAEQQFNDLPPHVRQAVMAKVALLEQDPAAHGIYSATEDTYTTDFTYGVIVYAIVVEHSAVILLRILAINL